jgi:hypothetical protein
MIVNHNKECTVQYRYEIYPIKISTSTYGSDDVHLPYCEYEIYGMFLYPFITSVVIKSILSTSDFSTNLAENFACVCTCTGSRNVTTVNFAHMHTK